MAKKFKKLRDLIKKIGKSPTAIKIIGRGLYYYSRLIGKTTRWEIHGMNEAYEIWEKEKAAIIIIWHGRALMFPHFWRKDLPAAALVSMHNDGRIIAELIGKYGARIISGSTTQGGKEAAIALKTSLDNGEGICIIPDGPVGPRMKMTDSSLHFAKMSGKPIFGATYSTEHAFVAKSWDAMMLPLPFCKGVMYVTKPFYIPHDATKEDIEKYKLEIEEELNNLTYKADLRMGIPKIEPGIAKKGKKHKKD